MNPNLKFAKLASQGDIEKTSKALKENGISVIVSDNREEAKKEILSLVPKGSEVFTMTSQTLEALDIPKIINDSGDYDSVRNKLNTMDRETQDREMAKLGAAPTYTVGSVHALTLDGKALIASNTGSQLPAYAYGAAHVIWVVGAQKIVKNVDEGIKRVYEYSLPLESVRAKKAYGIVSAVNKLLIFNRELRPGRIIVIIVKEKIGF